MHHLNLLPLNRRASLKIETLIMAGVRFIRSVAIGLIVLSVIGVIAIITLWLISWSMPQSIGIELSLEVDKYNNLSEIIVLNNRVLGLIGTLTDDQILWSDVLQALLVAAPPGVEINALRIDAATNLISFSGVANTRNSLVIFEERMELLPWIVELSAPKSNLLQRLNPDYSFTIVVDSSKVFSK